MHKLKMIVTTMGDKGVIVSFNDGTFESFKPLPLDPLLIKSAVGSGDSFMGGFIYGLSKGHDLKKCVEYG